LRSDDEARDTATLAIEIESAKGLFRRSRADVITASAGNELPFEMI
jgi:hypothetical protein